MSYDAPYRGLKVIDLSQGLAAPYCGMLMAQHGADVIKVEPTDGDWSRRLNTPFGDHSAFSIGANLGKRSIALDIKSEGGRAILWKLLDEADVLIEGFRPGVMDRIGFGYAAVSARVPRILFVSVSGFGDHGPLANRPAMDPVLQAYTGLVLANQGEDGVPRRVPVSIVDMSTGMYAYQALSAALYARQTLDHGRHIKVSLLQGAAAFQMIRLLQTTLDGAGAPVTTPPSGSFETQTGWVQIQITEEPLWVAMCATLGVPDLAHDPRFVDRLQRALHGPELFALLRPVFKRFTLEFLAERFTQLGMLFERLNSYTDFMHAEHTVETHAVSWLKLPGLDQALPVPQVPGLPDLQAGTARGLAPEVGEHSVAILREHGYDQAEVDRLLASRSVRVAERAVSQAETGSARP